MDNNLEDNDWKLEAPRLAGLPMHQPFSVPEGYFEDLGERINSEIITERLKVVAPAHDFAAVPPDYFNQLRANILAKTTGEAEKKQPAKVVRLWRSHILKYASAACFILLSATGLYFYEQEQQLTKLAYNDTATEQMLYDIDEQVIIEHIEANDLKEVKQSATDVALENYILNNYSQSEIASNL